MKCFLHRGIEDSKKTIQKFDSRPSPSLKRSTSAHGVHRRGSSILSGEGAFFHHARILEGGRGPQDTTCKKDSEKGQGANATALAILRRIPKLVEFARVRKWYLTIYGTFVRPRVPSVSCYGRLLTLRRMSFNCFRRELYDRPMPMTILDLNACNTINIWQNTSCKVLSPYGMRDVGPW